MKQGIVHRMVPATERLSVSHLSELAFEAPLHYHTEYELIHVISGSGVEFVGGGSAPYAPGTLTLIGAFRIAFRRRNVAHQTFENVLHANAGFR